jgi:predicted transposase YdaD
MFQLHDLRESKVWQEAQEEGKSMEKEEVVRRCLARGMSVKQTAEVADVPLKVMRRLAKKRPTVSKL